VVRVNAWQVADGVTNDELIHTDYTPSQHTDSIATICSNSVDWETQHHTQWLSE